MRFKRLWEVALRLLFASLHLFGGLMHLSRPLALARYSAPDAVDSRELSTNPHANNLSIEYETSKGSFLQSDAIRSTPQPKFCATRYLSMWWSKSSSAGKSGVLDRSAKRFRFFTRCQHTTAPSNEFRITETQRILPSTLFAVDNPDSDRIIGPTRVRDATAALENVARSASTFVDSHSSAASVWVFII